MVGTCNASLVSHVYAENLIWIPKNHHIQLYIYIQKQKSLVFRFQDCVSRLEYSYLNLNEFMAVQYGSCIFFTTTFPASEPGSDTVPSSFSAEKAHPVPTKSIARPAISTTSVLLLLQQSYLPRYYDIQYRLILDTRMNHIQAPVSGFTMFHLPRRHDASKLLLAVACHRQRAKNPSIWPTHQTAKLQRQHL